jgi:hypothetical protein
MLQSDAKTNSLRAFIKEQKEQQCSILFSLTENLTM